MEKHLEKLRARLKDLKGRIDEINAKDNLSAEDLVNLNALVTEMEQVEKDIETTQRGIDAQARTAVLAGQPVPAPAQETGTEVGRKLTAEQKVGLVACAMIEATGEYGRAGPKQTFKILQEKGFDVIAREFEPAQKRTLNSTAATAGGVLLPEDMSSTILDILRPNVTFLQGSPIRIPMPNGSYKQPAAASGATAAYRGETKRIAVTEPSFKALLMNAKLLGAIVPISNQLIRWSLPDVQEWVQRDLSLAMGVKMDHACFFGDGMEDTPLGIAMIPGVAHVDSVGGATPTYTQTDELSRRMIHAMLSTNLPPVRVEWRMSLRTLQWLQDMRDGNGNKIYPSLDREMPVWKNFPVRITNQISDNEGVTTDESTILLVAFGHVVFGDALAMQFAVSDIASVATGGDVIHAFQQGITLFRAEMEHDVDIRYYESVVVANGVRWGA